MNSKVYIGLAVLLVAGGIGAYILGTGGHHDGSSSAAVRSAAVSEAVDASSTSVPGAVTVAQAGTVPPPPGSEITIQPSGVHVTAQTIAQSASPPAGYVEYTNAHYGFSFYHAPEATVKVYNEGGGAITVVLENFAAARGFQIFVVPYADSKITEARFHEDEPSGVRTGVENTTLDGVPTVTFNSEDQTLGPTREIWSINNGYLYEITTLSGVGQWFTPIIESWRFFTPSA